MIGSPSAGPAEQPFVFYSTGKLQPYRAEIEACVNENICEPWIPQLRSCKDKYQCCYDDLTPPRWPAMEDRKEKDKFYCALPSRAWCPISSATILPETTWNPADVPQKSDWQAGQFSCAYGAGGVGPREEFLAQICPENNWDPTAPSGCTFIPILQDWIKAAGDAPWAAQNKDQYDRLMASVCSQQVANHDPERPCADENGNVVDCCPHGGDSCPRIFAANSALGAVCDDWWEEVLKKDPAKALSLLETMTNLYCGAPACEGKNSKQPYCACVCADQNPLFERIQKAMEEGKLTEPFPRSCWWPPCKDLTSAFQYPPALADPPKCSAKICEEFVSVFGKEDYARNIVQQLDCGQYAGPSKWIIGVLVVMGLLLLVILGLLVYYK